MRQPVIAMPELDVWQGVADELAAGGSCALLVVAESQASSPGRPGALMAVGPDGPLAGTIGGGVAESTLVERAAAAVRGGEIVSGLVVWEHREDAVTPSGLVCGGSQTVLVVPLRPADLAGVRRVMDALAAGRPVEWCADPGGWRVVMEGLSPGLGLVGESRHWSYAQRSGPTHSVHVIGAGHVGVALADLLMELEFRVVVVDERPSVDLGRIAAHERLQLAYEDLASVVPSGPTSFVAVMCHAVERDAACLAALQGIELGYLGLLGSRAKVHRLIGDRTMPGWFHAPIGLPIGSSTPAEIAVSVAAQMVGVRAGVRSSSALTALTT